MHILTKLNFRGLGIALELGPEKLIQRITDAGLTGRGGAGYPAGKKMEMVRTAPGMKYLICNADEGEPGTFKDKFIIEHNPELVIEGILIAAYAIGSDETYIYLRGEYAPLKPQLQKAIKKAQPFIEGMPYPVSIDIITGAGAYICGDETAIIQSLHNSRGHPEYKPPFPAERGLNDSPTLINNVETLANIPLLLADAKWSNDLRLVSLSGNVTKPGVYEVMLGTPLKDVIALGRPAKPIKAIYFGAAGGCIPYEEHVLLDQADIASRGAMLGSCSIIVVDDSKDLVDLAADIAKFFEFESCGKCIPCREGTVRMLELLQKLSLGEATQKDLALLEELAEVVAQTSFCGLGKSSANHLTTALRHFRNEFTSKLIAGDTFHENNHQ